MNLYDDSLGTRVYSSFSFPLNETLIGEISGPVRGNENHSRVGNDGGDGGSDGAGPESMKLG